ncbi:MAG TPA: hypothetical protein DCM62_03230 [Bacteroidales bacterium]|nr:hypothetical protein [Bacteroidales bacterium]
MSPRTQEQFENIRQAKKEQILWASLALFANNGYQSTIIGDIAKKAGISKGLLYNYFESKEGILLQLLDNFVAETTGLLNPNNDHEITNDEMSRFLEELIQSMLRQQDLWKLYLQLSVQPFVVDLVKNRIAESKPLLMHIQLIEKFFAERFDNPLEEMVIFSALIEGFIIQYLVSPINFSGDNTAFFLNRVKSMILIEKKKPDNTPNH